MNSTYYSTATLVACMIVYLIFNSRVNKYGFSQKDYKFVRKSHYFSKRKEMKAINRHIDLLNLFGTLAIILGYLLVVFSNISAIDSSVDLTAKRDVLGSSIIVDSYNSIFNYSDTKIGSPDCTMSLSWVGIALVCIFPIYLALSGLFYYFAFKLYTPKYWSNTFFYNLFMEKFNDEQSEKKQKIWMIVFMTTQIIINLLLILMFIVILSSENDISYYLENFKTECFYEYGEYGMNLSWMNIPCIVFNALTIVAFIVKVVSMCKLEDVTWKRYQASIISIYNEESESKIGNIK